MTAFSNITYNNLVETEISVEEWQTMPRDEQVEIMTEMLWEDIEVYPVTEDGEPLE
jgi:hypothetical protein